MMDRALSRAKPGDPWVKFGDVGIKYADLQAYRNRLARATVAQKNQPGPQPHVVTPAGRYSNGPAAM